MRRLFGIGAALGALALAGCSTGQLDAINVALDKYDAAISNFNAAVARIDTSVAFTSTSFAKYCTQAQSVGTNLVVVVKGSDVALTGLTTVTSAINSWCQKPPQSTADAVVAMTSAIAAAKSAYDAARHGG